MSLARLTNFSSFPRPHHPSHTRMAALIVFVSWSVILDRGGGGLPPLQITAWASSITAVLALIVALFKEDFQALWRRPKLVASAKLCAPDCHKTEVTLTDQQTGQIIDR